MLQPHCHFQTTPLVHRRARPVAPARPPIILLGIAAEETRVRLAAMLHNQGYTVTAARDGYHLIESISDAILDYPDSVQPDLIIVDAVLSGCTGLSLLTGLRDLHWGIPMILLTTADDDQTRRQAEGHGITTLSSNFGDFTKLRQLTNDLLRDGSTRSAEAT